jgi:cation:H+ antiporter
VRWALIALTIVLAMPGMFVTMTGTSFGLVMDTALQGAVVVAAAFLLSWSADALQVDLSQGLALALIALIAVLPEYAVDVTFAWKAGQDPRFAPYAIANMTGANRLLIGVAWPLVFAVFWLKTRQRVLVLERSHALEVLTLTIASAYALTFLFKSAIGLVDTVVLVLLFAGYIALISRAPATASHLIGPAATIGALSRRIRYVSIAALMIYAAGAIVIVAEPFAEGLIETGTALGVDEFLMVQIVAPIASETPEFLIAGLLAFHGNPGAGLGALISSKVNQWTLLVGALPVAYTLARGEPGSLPLDAHQWEEVFLTAAQSVFAVSLITRGRLTWWAAVALFTLFVIQFLVPSEGTRLVIAWTYLALALLILIVRRTSLRALVRTTREVTRSYRSGATTPAMDRDG